MQYLKVGNLKWAKKKATVYNKDETSNFHLIFLNVENWG